ncbi:MAG: antibiotic biosynthesis monooxygenase family protein [Rhodococcus sp. (in: high G+C Gram-positive bacteria)]
MTFSVVARYTVRAGHTDQVLEHLARVREQTLQEPGCLSYQPHRSSEDDNVVFIIESYTQPSDFDHHISTDHFKDDVLGKVLPLLTERTVVKGVPAS